MYPRLIEQKISTALILMSTLRSAVVRFSVQGSAVQNTLKQGFIGG
jgi:hypothetical protein